MKIVVVVLFALLIFPVSVFARVSLEDQYQERYAEYEAQVNAIKDPNQRIKIKKAEKILDQINQTVCSRFDEDVAKMSAVLQELRRRKGIEDQPTVVAYGEGKTQLEDAEYWVNWAGEAVAYQKSHNYLPLNITSSTNSLRSDLGVLKNKILKAKGQVEMAVSDAK